jgi:hypothetical protein
VKLFYVDLSTLQQGSAVNRQEIQPPTELPLPADQIISSVEFANNSTLIAVWMNRVQNNAYIQACQGVSCRMVSIFRSTATRRILLRARVNSFAFPDQTFTVNYWLGGVFHRPSFQ